MRLLFLCLSLLVATSAGAEKRVGLIIGNDSYTSVPRLAKAVADADAIALKLAENGFETVLATDVSRREMNRAITRFTNLLEPGDTALVFYAGHGVEIDGQNFLLPTDILAPAEGERDLVMSESIGLANLLDRVRRTGARTTIAIIDACRDNPFEAATGRSLGRTRGLGRINAPEGTFVVYSAGAGQMALDGLNEADDNQNSVFTRLLLPKLDQKGLELRTLIADLRVEVRDLAKTQNHAQFPAYYDELLGDFYFKSGRGLEPVNVAEAPDDAPSIRADFAMARELDSPFALEAFLEKYGDSDDFTVELARRMLANLTADAPKSEDGPAHQEEASLRDPKPQESQDEPADNRKDIIRESQLELRRLGCSPGGADGVLGPRSRAAFGRFVTQTGSSLSQNSLGTITTLDVLKATAAPACKSPVVTPAPTGDDPAVPTPVAAGLDISGTWNYSYFCIVVPGTGSVVYRRTGADRFTGRFKDSLGQTGTISLSLSGRNYTARLVNQDGAVAHETGRFSSDGRSYKSTSHSVGCAVKGSKAG